MFWGGQAFLTCKIKYGGFFKVDIVRTTNVIWRNKMSIWEKSNWRSKPRVQMPDYTNQDVLYCSIDLSHL